jgi:hypothetical protein
MEDHLDMLIKIPLTLAFSDAIKEIKTGSSQWIGPRFAWQRGFGVFGVSESNEKTGPESRFLAPFSGTTEAVRGYEYFNPGMTSAMAMLRQQ